MPKVPVYTLAWSPVTAAYELYQTRDREALRIAPDSPEWFSWLDQVSSFAFSGKSGHYTARKEAKQRGDRYWSAYLATGERLTKRYLGKTADLTLARLEHIAGILSVQSAAAPSQQEMNSGSSMSKGTRSPTATLANCWCVGPTRCAAIIVCRTTTRVSLLPMASIKPAT